MRYVDPKLSCKRAEAGRKGGYATFMTHGREQMQDWGRLGGRPRNLTLAEIEQRQRTVPTNKKEGECRPAFSVSYLSTTSTKARPAG